MKVSKATRKYEKWLDGHVRLIRSDLELKHKLMAENAFSFLRGTFYRWIQRWPEVCPDLAKAPTVLAVGDLHVENFGTWRDREGRLVWGVNDFDEVYPMPYANDLVRLAVSAHLALSSGHLRISSQEACKALLVGYAVGLKVGGMPFVLEEQHNWLRRAATGELRNPVRFWAKMNSWPTTRDVPKSAKKALESLLPEQVNYKIVHRIAGVGSLGRERFVALADFEGGRIAREAKALAPSACVWAWDTEGSRKILYETILESALRAADPLVCVRGRWLVRRLAPDCSRIELATLPKQVDEKRLLEAMGFETANVHSGCKAALKRIRRDLETRRGDWLHVATKKMINCIVEDYEDWCKT